jgi:hypothetical protein
MRSEGQFREKGGGELRGNCTSMRDARLDRIFSLLLSNSSIDPEE